MRRLVLLLLLVGVPAIAATPDEIKIAMAMERERHKHIAAPTPPPPQSARYIDPPGWHRHKCPKCGTVITHQPEGYDRFTGQPYGTDAAHTCPKCGTITRELYKGPKRPDYYFGDSPPPEVRQPVPQRRRVTAANCPT